MWERYENNKCKRIINLNYNKEKLLLNWLEKIKEDAIDNEGYFRQLKKE